MALPKITGKATENYLYLVNGYTEDFGDMVTIYPLGGDDITMPRVNLEEFCRQQLEEIRRSLADQGEDIADYLQQQM